eukprot:47742-Eustigmatos_ZCMA.PRE.1
MIYCPIYTYQSDIHIACTGPAVLLRTGRRGAPSARVKGEAASKLTEQATELYNQGQLHDALQHYIDAAQEARFGGHVGG